MTRPDAAAAADTSSAPSPSNARPTVGVRYALERTLVEPEQVTYEGFAHLPDADVPLVVRVALPGGAVTATGSAAAPADEARAASLAKAVTPLVRAATKAQAAAGQELPRKIVRWRG